MGTRDARDDVRPGARLRLDQHGAVDLGDALLDAAQPDGVGLDGSAIEPAPVVVDLEHEAVVVGSQHQRGALGAGVALDVRDQLPRDQVELPVQPGGRGVAEVDRDGPGGRAVAPLEQRAQPRLQELRHGVLAAGEVVDVRTGVRDYGAQFQARTLERLIRADLVLGAGRLEVEADGVHGLNDLVVQIACDSVAHELRLDLGEQALPLLLRGPLLADVAHDRGDERTVGALGGAEADLDGQLGAVLAPGPQLEAGPHRARRQRGCVARAMAAVVAAQRLRHERSTRSPISSSRL